MRTLWKPSQKILNTLKALPSHHLPSEAHHALAAATASNEEILAGACNQLGAMKPVERCGNGCCNQSAHRPDSACGWWMLPGPVVCA
mmetsp:Transcript_50405/g.119857  ORF Transcript_50405/g.119857 Transcript_50405/m.119857 type:complete len:87 (-) Transcript_50405:56-316(-)